MHDLSGVPFDPSKLVILSAVEHARRRPAMYLESTDADGLHTLLGYAIGGVLSHYHALDRPLDGLTVQLHDDGSASVASHGPIVDTPTLCKSAERLRWELEHMGTPGPIALCVVNALSVRIDVRCRASNADWYHLIYCDRHLAHDTVEPEATDQNDIALTFWPDTDILQVTHFDYARICASLPTFAREFDDVAVVERAWSGSESALAVPIEVIDQRRPK